MRLLFNITFTLMMIIMFFVTVGQCIHVAVVDK